MVMTEMTVFGSVHAHSLGTRRFSFSFHTQRRQLPTAPASPVTSNALHQRLARNIQKQPVINRALTAGPNFIALLTGEFCAFDHDSPLTCKHWISALALKRKVPSNAEYACAEAKIRRLPMKYACRKHRIPCFRKLRFCGKQSHDIGTWSLSTV